MEEIMSDYKLEFELLQQTPLVQFQSYEDGVCLRASEVKPRLDQFIINELKKINKVVPKDWLIKKDNKGTAQALNYKLQIISQGEIDKSDETETEIVNLTIYKKEDKIKCKHKIKGDYFANMVGSSDRAGLSNRQLEDLIRERYKDTIYLNPHKNSQIRGRIYCFDKELKKCIEDHYKEFFLFNNFGTRKSKGFGSFIVKENRNESIESNIKIAIDKMLAKKQNFCYLQFNQISPNEMLESIKMISMLMKSGINFANKIDSNTGKSVPTKTPKDYFKGLALINEINKKNTISDKAFMKKKCLNENTNNDTYSYYRGLLGLTDGVSFRAERDNPLNKKKINIYNKEDIKINETLEFENEKKDKKKKMEKIVKIDRFNNPILFKPIGNYLFIIPQTIPDLMMGRSFYFSTFKETEELKYSFSEKDVIITPTSENFKLEEFLFEFADYYNQDGEFTIFKNAKTKELQKLKQVKMSKKEGE